MNVPEERPGDGRRAAILLALLFLGPLAASAALVAMIVSHADPAHGIDFSGAPKALRRAIGYGGLFLAIVPPAAVGLLSRESWPVRILLALLLGTGGLIATLCAGFAAFQWLGL